MSENLLKEESVDNKEEFTDNYLEQTEVIIAPKKFLDKETGEINVQALLKSYLELEKKLSEKNNSYPKIPSSIDEYNIVCNKDYFDIDSELNQRLLEAGFTQEQAQLVYNIGEEKMVPMLVEIASCFQSDKEKSRLEEKFGGKEKWKEVSSQLLKFGKSKLPPKVLEGLSSSYDGVIALYNMMIDDAPAMSISEDIEVGASQEELYKMMKNPKYWRSKDPEFVSKVTEGFKKIYK